MYIYLTVLVNLGTLPGKPTHTKNSYPGEKRMRPPQLAWDCETAAWSELAIASSALVQTPLYVNVLSTAKGPWRYAMNICEQTKRMALRNESAFCEIQRSPYRGSCVAPFWQCFQKASPRATHSFRFLYSIFLPIPDVWFHSWEGMWDSENSPDKQMFTWL